MKCSGKTNTWITYENVRNKQEFLKMMFKKELENLLDSIQSLVGLSEFKESMFPKFAMLIKGQRIENLSRPLPRILTLGARPIAPCPR